MILYEFQHLLWKKSMQLPPKAKIYNSNVQHQRKTTVIIIDLLHVRKKCSLLTFLNSFNFKCINNQGGWLYSSQVSIQWPLCNPFPLECGVCDGTVNLVIHVNKNINIIIHSENSNLSYYLPQNHYLIAWLWVTDTFSRH